MSVHFWISVGDIAWLSCFVVLYNLGCLSLFDDEKLCETSIAFLFFVWFPMLVILILLVQVHFCMLVTETGSLLYWCLMKRADLLCTISIFLIWFSWSGSQALLAYSTLALTIAWYALFFISSGNLLIFLLKKPSVVVVIYLL